MSDAEWIWRWRREAGPLPLDRLLSRSANLKVLRALVNEGKPCWPIEIARITGLSRSAVHGALIRLADLKVVEAEVIWGARRSFPQRLIADHPIVEDLTRLFRTEWRLMMTGIPGRYDPPGPRR